jgi:hypothetical protein
VVSARTLLKEAAKRKLGQIGNARYAMHGSNETLRPITLRDGQPVYEFMRCNPHWGGVSSCEQGRHIGQVLTDSLLDRLVQRGGTSILYTHLGKIDDARIPFNQEAVCAFRRLADEFHAGRVLVTTTRRLLAYRRAVREITYESCCRGRELSLHVNTQSTQASAGALSADDLHGLTFYVPDPEVTTITVDGRKAATIRRNAPDHTGRPSVSLPWPMLEFPGI